MADVLSGRRPPSRRIVRACVELNLPAAWIFGAEAVAWALAEEQPEPKRGSRDEKP